MELGAKFEYVLALPQQLSRFRQPDTAEDTQQRSLAAAVAALQNQCLTGIDAEAEVFK